MDWYDSNYIVCGNVWLSVVTGLIFTVAVFVAIVFVATTTTLATPAHGSISVEEKGYFVVRRHVLVAAICYGCLCDD